jgi:hypothetical protein
MLRSSSAQIRAVAGDPVAHLPDCPDGRGFGAAIHCLKPQFCVRASPRLGSTRQFQTLKRGFAGESRRSRAARGERVAARSLKEPESDADGAVLRPAGDRADRGSIASIDTQAAQRRHGAFPQRGPRTLSQQVPFGLPKMTATEQSRRNTIAQKDVVPFSRAGASNFGHGTSF